MLVDLDAEDCSYAVLPGQYKADRGEGCFAEKRTKPTFSVTLTQNYLKCIFINRDGPLPVDTVSQESGDTETCLLVERSPGHQGPLAHPAPKNTICSLTFKHIYTVYLKMNNNRSTQVCDNDCLVLVKH